MTSDHEPGVYAKGEKTRIAQSPSDAVAAVFDGFVRQGPVPLAVEQALSEDPGDTPEYRKLQERARELGIKANQSSAALQEQIAAKEGEGA